jgi:hypothetical protein
MISLDPLYFLLLLEGLLLQAMGLGLLYLKWRKAKRAYRDATRNLQDVKQKEPSKKTDGEISLGEIVPAGQEEIASLPPLEMEDDGQEVEKLKKLLEEKVEIILQMKKKIESMEQKFVDMENEYLILFDQSQKQEQALKAAGLSLNTEGGDF